MARRAVALLAVSILSLAACGDRTADQKAAPGSNEAQSTTVLARYPGLAPAPITIKDQVFAADDGYPSQIWAFDLRSGDRVGTLVNPPIPIFFTTLATDGHLLLAVGLDCSDARKPGIEDEPTCGGGLVVQRYSPETRVWEVANEQNEHLDAYQMSGAGIGNGEVLSLFYTEQGVRTARISPTGTIIEIPPPPGRGSTVGDDNAYVKLCSTSDGVLAFSGNASDIGEGWATATVYNDGEKGWDEPVPIGNDLAADLGGSSICTGSGVAVLGFATGTKESTPSAVFYAGTWRKSEGPPFAETFISMPGAGVFADGTLWAVTKFGLWRKTSVVVQDVISASSTKSSQILAITLADNDRARLTTIANE